jgi:hypothetical protein
MDWLPHREQKHTVASTQGSAFLHVMLEWQAGFVAERGCQQTRLGAVPPDEQPCPRPRRPPGEKQPGRRPGPFAGPAVPAHVPPAAPWCTMPPQDAAPLPPETWTRFYPCGARVRVCSMHDPQSSLPPIATNLFLNCGRQLFCESRLQYLAFTDRCIHLKRGRGGGGGCCCLHVRLGYHILEVGEKGVWFTAHLLACGLQRCLKLLHVLL